MEQIHFTSGDEWRNWLTIHHTKKTEGIWLIFYKKKTKKPTISYVSAVEEALCFGWIDSIVKKLDEERYIQKFSPRKKISNWSGLNKTRVENLIKAGKMTQAGFKAIETAKLNGKWNEISVHPTNWKLSPELESILILNTIAFHNYQKLSPSHKNEYVHWIMGAKKEETRHRRMLEMIEKLEKGIKLGLK